MKPRSRSTNWGTRLAAAIALTLGTAFPAAAGQVSTESGLKYHPVVLEKDGRVSLETLDRMALSLKKEATDPATQIVVLIHGFDTGLKQGEKDYQQVSRRLQNESRSTGLRTAVVGIHWHSEAGDQAAWVSQAVAHRLTSLLGMKKAVKNPYLEKWKLARRVGRTGARAVFFRLQDELPGLPVHVFAHSLGSEVVVSALAPETTRGHRMRTATLEQPGRELRLDVVTLAGADLDHDVFSRNPVVLERARQWWVTVPGQDRADAILELRRGAGRPDALGNRGLSLEAAELERLQSRKILVLDRGNIPVGHAFVDYFSETRLQALADSLASGIGRGQTVAQGTAIPSS